MPAVRAKFIVTFLDRERGEVELEPVMSGGAPENASFWEATPDGNLSMTITNKRALNRFNVGQEYYLDFTSADEAEEEAPAALDGPDPREEVEPPPSVSNPD